MPSGVPVRPESEVLTSGRSLCTEDRLDAQLSSSRTRPCACAHRYAVVLYCLSIPATSFLRLFRHLSLFRKLTHWTKEETKQRRVR